MRLAAWFGREDVKGFAEDIGYHALDDWIATGITSWPELLANGFAAVCQAMGASSISADMFRTWEPPLEVSEEVMIAQMNAAYGAR